MTGTDSDLSPAADSGGRLGRHAVVLDAAAVASTRLQRIIQMLDAIAAHIAPRLDAAAGAIVRRIYPQLAAAGSAVADHGGARPDSCRRAPGGPGAVGTVPANPA
ncbi:hypothetical protein ACWD0J_35580 [Streptomyces sp. NPDC003011]